MCSKIKVNLINFLIFFIFITIQIFFIGALICSPVQAAPNDMPNWTMPEPKLQIPINSIKFTAPQRCGGTDQQPIYCVGWIGQYIAGIYQYAIGIVGILAAVVLMFGGIIWLTAGGSATQITNAKAWIGASLTGLVIALCSYMILYMVNPDLTIFKPLQIQLAKKGEIATSSVSTAIVCQKYKDSSTNTIIYDNIPSSDILTLPSQCSNFNFGSGSLAKYLKAIAAAESSCNSSPSVSSAGACGLMQLLPQTAQQFDPLATCQYLIDNPDKSIEIATKFINKNIGVHKGNPSIIFAGYNSGYSSSPNPKTGKKSALVQSSDCPGYYAFQCCILPGDLVETQVYVYRAIEYLNSQL